MKELVREVIEEGERYREQLTRMREMEVMGEEGAGKKVYTRRGKCVGSRSSRGSKRRVGNEGVRVLREENESIDSLYSSS